VLMSATMGLVETDIKRVIAYSTLNSLGLMFVALGSGSVTAAMLYLFVHGFFKALLFLASGSVIHATEKQDIRELGGLAAKMPVTAAVFGIGTLAMIGVIPLSGFWAKDEVLHALDQHRSVVLYMLALISVFITALYMTRLFVRTFLYEARDRVAWGHSHDAEPLMTLPLVLLAGLTAAGGFVVFAFAGEALGFPGGFGEFVFFEDSEPFDFALDVAILSTALAVGGIVTGWYFWSEKAEPARRAGEALQPAYETLRNRYYIDDAYQWVIDRVVLTLGTVVAWFDRNIVNDTAVDGSAGLGLFAGFELKFLETGKLPNYALAIVAGVIGLAVLLLVLRL
jgi:NADH-quinone oxidoreductase subunit L